MNKFTRVTEQASNYDHLETMSIPELLRSINEEDQKVPLAIQKSMDQIEKLTTVIVEKLLSGGRLFYLGAGTSGRLGILDASECPPTFGVSDNLVIGLIAGGDRAIRDAVEFAEDDVEQAWKDLQARHISEKDIVVGIAASGTTPYVIGGLKACREHHIVTGCITCNEGSPLAKEAQFPIEVLVGPEFVTGSTRMKAGTAQKLVLNMLSTATMIRLGRVQGNRMVDMQLSNDKLKERGVLMICEKTKVSRDKAAQYLEKYGSVRAAINKINGEH